jgi:hypothetical protein
MRLFKVLDAAEEAAFRQSAREHYKPLVDPISPIWHPAYQDECVKMNSEASWNADARYDRVECLSCGREWQDIDFGSAAHMSVCAKPEKARHRS